MKVRVWAAAIAALAASSCVGSQVTPPAPAHIEKTREIEAPFDAVWLRAVDWFAGSNITIEKIERPSGLITAKYSLVTSQEYLDCGNIQMSGVLEDPRIERRGTLNVTIRTAGVDSSVATANFFGEFVAVGRDVWVGAPVRAEGMCVSTGTIERQFLDYVSAAASSPPPNR